MWPWKPSVKKTWRHTDYVLLHPGSMKMGQHAWMWRDGSACNRKRDVPYFLGSSEFSSAHLLSKGHRERHQPLRVFWAREGTDDQREHLVSQALLVSFCTDILCSLHLGGLVCSGSMFETQFECATMVQNCLLPGSSAISVSHSYILLLVCSQPVICTFTCLWVGACVHWQHGLTSRIHFNIWEYGFAPARVVNIVKELHCEDFCFRTEVTAV